MTGATDASAGRSMLPVHQPWNRCVARLVGLASALVWLATSTGVRAFSDPVAYSDAAELGGGGGRWFTGSSADGFGCDVCHRGRAGTHVTVSGLPLAGYAPGQPYEITLSWPADVPGSMVAELTDEQRRGAGTIALPRPDAFRPEELCAPEQGGAIPSEVHDTEHARQLVSLVDCGARLLRFQWTAPLTAASAVWFNAGFVASNEDASPAGDGVTLLRRVIPPIGSRGQERIVAQGCSALSQPPATSAGVWVLMSLAVLICRYRRRVT